MGLGKQKMSCYHYKDDSDSDDSESDTWNRSSSCLSYNEYIVFMDQVAVRYLIEFEEESHSSLAKVAKYQSYPVSTHSSSSSSSSDDD